MTCREVLEENAFWEFDDVIDWIRQETSEWDAAYQYSEILNELIEINCLRNVFDITDWLEQMANKTDYDSHYRRTLIEINGRIANLIRKSNN